MSSQSVASVYRPLGLSLLYASGYFLPLLGKDSSYFIPSIWQYIFWPMLVVVVFLTPLIAVSNKFCSSYIKTPWHSVLVLTFVTIFVLIGIKVVFAAADYPWPNLIRWAFGPYSNWTMQKSAHRLTIIAAFFLIFVGLLIFRSKCLFLVKILSALGYALFILALFRVASYPPLKKAEEQVQSPKMQTAHGYSRSGPTQESQKNAISRKRVVWVIFDEMDYNQAFGSTSIVKDKLRNFTALASKAVFAEQANSPARDTIASIPALLMGVPLSGIKILGPANQQLVSIEGKTLSFDQANTVFARLPQGPQSASIQGFYHPYCEIFQIGACESHFLENAGHWFDGLVSLFPGSLLFDYGDPMFRVSEKLLDALPNTLARSHEALTFIHINIPHLPASYAQKAMGMPHTSDERAMYAQNLIAADRVVGQIIRQLQSKSATQEILLIVSADHWFRFISPETVQPVPFIAWKVGDTSGQVITQPISTIHTAALVLDFLNDKVNSQEEIAHWWRDKPVYSTWLPPTKFEYQ